MADTRLVFNILAHDRNASRTFKKVARSADEVNRSTAGLSKSTRQADKDTAHLSSVFKKLSPNALRAAGSMTKVAAGAAALSVLSGAAASSAASMVSLAAALAPVGGLVAALPGAVGLAVAGFATLKLATVGVGDAFRAALGSDMEAFKESLKGLSPAARGVALELHKVRPALLSIKNAAQEGLFRPLLGQITATTTALKGPLRAAFYDLGRQIGGAGAQVAQFARDARTVAAIKAIFFDATQATAMFRNAIGPLLGGFRELARVGAGFLTTLAPAITRAGMAFGQWLSEVSRSGQVTQWLNSALTVLKSIGTILTNVGGILSSVFKAASANGGNLLGTFGQLTGELNKFLKSAEGASALRSIFSAIGQIGKALAPVVIAIGKSLGTLAPALGRIATIVGPVLTTAINALAPALAALEPGITALINGLGGAFNALAPVLPAVAGALSSIAVALSPLLPALGKIVAMLASGLAAAIQQLVSSGALTSLVGSVAQLAYSLSGALLQALTAIAPYLPELVISLSDLLIALIPLIPPFADLVVAIAPLIPVVTDVINLVTQLANAVMPVLTYALYSQKVATELLVSVVQKAWGFIRESISAQINLIKISIDWFRELPGRMGAWFARAGDAAGRKLSDLVGIIRNVPGQIVRALGNLGNLLWNAGRAVITGLINGIVSRFNALRNVLGSVTRAIPNWKGPFDTDKKLLTPAGTAIMGGLIKGITGQLPALKATLGGVTQTIAATPAPALAGAGQPGAARQSTRSGIDYDRLEAALIRAVRDLGDVYIDGQKLTDAISRRQGRDTALRRRTR